MINFPFTILNPYFMSEVAQILNKICPGCKSMRHIKIKVKYHSDVLYVTFSIWVEKNVCC